MKQQILQSALDRLRDAWLEVDEAENSDDYEIARLRFFALSKSVLGCDLYNIFPTATRDADADLKPRQYLR